MASKPELAEYKDKIEVSLDGRQIFYLFFGGAVLVGLVFVLGVMVGRRVESRSHVDGLSRMDPSRGASDPLAALDGLENRKLSFQDALTKDPPKMPVDQQIEDLAKAKADPAKPGEAKPEDKKVEKVEKKDDKVEKKDDKVEKKPEKKVDKKADKKDEPVTKPEQAAKSSSEKSEKKKPALDERINADVITAVDKPVEKKSDTGKFTLQLSSFQDKHEAEAFLSSVKSAGYSAYVTEAEVNGKGTFYRVRMGKYTSLEAATDAKADVERAIKKSASVMRL